MDSKDVQKDNVSETMNENTFPGKDSDDIEPIASGSFTKLNGDHYGSNKIIQNNEDSCSSTNSSSSHNLIIDQPEEVSFNIASNESDDKFGKKIIFQEKNNINPLKRKYSNIENGSPECNQLNLINTSPLPRFSPPKFNLKSPTHNITDNKTDCNENKKNDKRRKNTTGIRESLQKRKVENEDHFQEYAKYLKLKPSVKYKCFKCYNNTFETLTQLRNHQKICLFKENHRHSSQDGNSFDAYVSSNSNLSADNVLTIPTIEQIQERLEKQYIETKTTAKAKKKVFLCAACGTYYENWNLFLHMREVHGRHICLYCVGMFPTAERLTLHLEMKHDLEQNHFESHEKLLRASRDTCYLMCCICEHIFTEHEDFQDHNCSELIPPCSLCGQKGRHTSNCQSLHSERPPKEKSKRKSKISREINIQGKKPDKLHTNVNPIANEDTRLIVENVYDAKKTKDDNTNYWNFKVNGCITKSTVKSTENLLQSKEEDILGRSYLSPENNEIQLQPLNLSNPNNLTVEVQKNVNYISNEVADIKEVLSTESVDQYLNNKNEDMQKENLSNFENTETLQAGSEYTSVLEEMNSNNINKSSNTENITSSDIAAYDPGDSEKKQVDVEIETPPNSTEAAIKIEEQKPLFVPKFKIKIPKGYQVHIDSEHSSTESDEEPEQSINDGDISNEENQQESQKKENEIENNGENVEVKENETLEHEDTSKLEAKCETKSDIETVSLSKSKVEDVNVPIELEEKSTDIPEDDIPVANDDVLLIELLLDRPIDKISMVEFLRICLRSTYPICLYCNHARRIAVNGHSLALHLLEQHRFSATVDSITAEELQPATIIIKLKSFLPDLENIFFNLETYCSTGNLPSHPYDKLFECFLCRFETKIHKELYLHNRKMHLKTAILCFMCRANFFSYSEILCHMCPGMPNKCVIFDIKFRCCLCDIDQIPSAFRLMVHLRKKHFACDVCLEDCQDQSKLSSHVWKHKLHHLCYRCGIAYRNKPDITKHLFWKHGTESILCKRCLQKRWPHVYHFCIPPPSFICEICNIAFSKSMFLKVHKRLHTGDAPYPCTEDNCDNKFISRRLLLKHVAQHNEQTEIKAQEETKQENEPRDDENIEIDHKEEICKVEETKKDIESNKKKRKKAKKEQTEENIDDLIPAPNLSESDSSDDSESGGSKVKHDLLSPSIPKVMLSPPSDNGDEEKDSNPTPMMDIWENFKTFQAKQNKNKKDENEVDTSIPPVIPILHVLQSDHDYSMMYKAITKEDIKDDDKLDISNESKTDLNNTKALKTPSTKDTSPKSKKQKSPRKDTKSGSDSSSSGSSSSSDSSCSCVSNCSCSSSSSSSSDSSSSSEDSDSSTSEGKRRIAAKRAAKEEKRNRNKSDNSPKTVTSDIVDVVTTDTKPNEEINYNSIILETDLETDESETDEDFYDEHPQKLATQMLAEKRKQLMMQTCLSPSHNFDIVENSRPSTPSLPEEITKEKKVKIKKKKREKKVSKGATSLIPSFKLNIPNILTADVNNSLTFEVANEISKLDVNVPTLSAPASLVIEPSNLQPNLPLQPQQPQQIPQNVISTPIAAPIATKNRLSTGSNSDADAPLKRSKRARRPNKFYGYTSDDDSVAPHLSGLAAFKPTPPPNLTWRKEDLPTPSKSIIAKSNKSSVNSSKKNLSLLINTPPLPPIPSIIIRPSGGTLQSRISSTSLTTDLTINKPPAIIEPLRVPPVPVHHIQQPPPYYPPSRESMESESSDEERLHIPISTKASYNTHLNQKQQLQQQQQHQQQQQYINPILTGLRQFQPQQQHQQSQQNITTAMIAPSNPVSISTPPVTQKIPPALLPNPDLATIQYFQRNNIRWPIRPPAGARPPRDGESVYCYCRCPYDEVSEMIACDGDDCMIEWFHFECVGIMVPPKGKWFCPECKPKYPHEVSDESYENT